MMTLTTPSERLPGAPVSAAHSRQFRQDGHTLTRQLITEPELKLYRPAILNAVSRLNTEKRRMEERDTYGKAFLQIMNLWEFDEAVRPFVLARRFGAVAAQLMGVGRVRLYHDQALFKEPGGGATPWHQDQYYWPLDTGNMITMWMPLVDVTVEMGMLTFATGSHKEGLVRNVSISDASEVALNDLVREKGFEISRPDFLRAGDATWHYGLTLHRAPGNDSEIMREVMTVIYFADGARVTHPQSEHQEADRQRWLGGIEPGELADGPLNPVI
jgi:ectoine hydroxylase-related dioxygenase (phytanoyl-CoA dioxygenase family)